jgi:prolyl oligopeptidase
MRDDDPYLWLEDVDGERALEWARARSGEVCGAYAVGDGFRRARDGVREVLDAEGRVPSVTRRGEHLYDFWRDAAHPRGLWRRTTLEEFRGEDPAWEVLLDLDALAADEGENWVWSGADVLRPAHRLALVGLSRGGADAHVVREFDLEAREFVAGGFALPEAKSEVGWIDADRVWVGTDTGPGSLTDSGYPRTVREWKRGTPLEEAVVAFEGEASDVSVHVEHQDAPGFERDVASRYPDFFTGRHHLLTADGPVLIDVPGDAHVDVHHEWLLLRTTTPWTTGGVTHPAGALIVTGFEAFMAGGREFTTLFAPDGRSALESHAWTANHLVLTLLRDVATELVAMAPGPDGWSAVPLPGVAEFGTATVVSTSPERDDEYFLVTESLTTPPVLVRGTVGGATEVLRRGPELFDAAGLVTEQLFAVSDDGTRVPYFLVRPRGAQGRPVLMTGYGGFDLSRKPVYNAVAGRSWLERGGSCVLANIRGGGEYGPRWHTDAILEHRHRAYEDFAAVARDLAARGICPAERLAVHGGSNGGLLTGVMLTRYPELFGAIASQVPLMDMKRYHRLLAGASWMAEFGDPDDPRAWEWLRAYSPYHNVDPDRAYPPVLIATSTRDDRVHPGHARKMAAALLAAGKDAHYFENVEGGHGGAANNEQNAFRWALVTEFLWRHVGG